MDYISGNIYIRTTNAMKKDEVILGHRHNFDHTTVCLSGSLEVSLLKPTELNEEGNPLAAEVDKTVTLHAGDEMPWFLVLKGRFHALRALEDGTRYGCFYSHRIPQALNIEHPGGVETPPISKRDENGVLWVQVDERVVQDTAEWAAAYR